MQYIYHLGVHTTPSELLQHNLTENLDALRAQGVFYVNAEAPDIIGEILMLVEDGCQSEVAQDYEKLNGINQSLAQNARAGGMHKVLFSNDDLLGPSLSDLLSSGVETPEFYPDAAARLSLATAAIPLRSTTFVIYQKSPEQLLLDLYCQALGQGQTALGLETFCTGLELQSICFEQLRAQLQVLHSKLRVIMPEDRRLEQGSGAFVREFCQCTGINPEAFSITPTKVKYRIDTQQAEALRHVTMGNPSTRPSLINSLREQILKHRADPRQALALPDWVKAQLSGQSDDVHETHMQKAG
ncbi:MAG: hypothetical protein AAGF53_03360 [Pseudomonadota bacterium]